MKKFYVFLVLTTLLCSICCSSSDDNITEPLSNNDRTLSFYGASPVAVDTVQGQFIKDYQISSTIEGSFSASSFSNSSLQTLLLFMYDDDENSLPFTNNGVFPINSDPIRATARYTNTSLALDIQATSGSVTVSEYRRIEDSNRTLIEISGSFDFTDGSEHVFGTFENIRVQCLECN